MSALMHAGGTSKTDYMTQIPSAHTATSCTVMMTCSCWYQLSSDDAGWGPSSESIRRQLYYVTPAVLRAAVDWCAATTTAITSELAVGVSKGECT
jgi:hypothetical protein